MATIINFLKSFLTGASFKSTLYLIILIIAGILTYKFYRFSYDRGVASNQEQVTAAQKATDEAKADLAVYKTTYQQWMDSQTKAQATLDAQQKTILETLNTQVSALNTKLAQTQEALKHVTQTYVTPKGDASCVLPSGFVLLYNQTIRADAGTGAPLLTVPSGFDVDAPSGLPCSTAASLISANNLDAVKYRQALMTWQSWYNANAKAIQDYQSVKPMISQ